MRRPPAIKMPPVISSASALSVSFGQPTVVHTASTTAISSIATPTRRKRVARTGRTRRSSNTTISGAGSDVHHCSAPDAGTSSTGMNYVCKRAAAWRSSQPHRRPPGPARVSPSSESPDDQHAKQQHQHEVHDDVDRQFRLMVMAPRRDRFQRLRPHVGCGCNLGTAASATAIVCTGEKHCGWQ